MQYMNLRHLSLITLVWIAGACGGGAAGNSNQAAANNANLPAGMQPMPIQPSGESTPGIPPQGQAYVVEKGPTPTPGIDPANVNVQMKPGATPTPGIPDQETIRRQMNQRNTNVNAPPPAAANTSSTMPDRKQPRPVGQQ